MQAHRRSNRRSVASLSAISGHKYVAHERISRPDIVRARTRQQQQQRQHVGRGVPVQRARVMVMHWPGVPCRISPVGVQWAGQEIAEIIPRDGLLCLSAKWNE